MSEHGPIELGALSAAWLRYQNEPLEELAWSVLRVQELAVFGFSIAWDLAVSLCDAADSPELLCDIGAGPLEDSIRKFGSEFIARINEFADNKPKVLNAATCVWLKSNPDLEAQLVSLLSSHGQSRL